MREKRLTFTKLVISSVMMTYFAGFGLGFYVTLRDFSQLSSLLTYIGVPTSAAIGFYAWKAKCENVVKIRRSLNAEALELKRRLSELAPEMQSSYEDIRLDVDEILSELDN